MSMPRVPSKSGKPVNPPGPDQSRGNEDLVRRLRSLLWCAVVKSRYPGESWNGMDTYFLGEVGEGTRTFWRIQENASNPGLGRNSLGGDSVVDRVARMPGYFHTREIFESELFVSEKYSPVLGPDPLTVMKREALIGDVLSRLRLVEVTDDDRWIANANALTIPGTNIGTRDLLRRWLKHFGRKRKIDHILLMCLLYRRAVERGALEEAIDFRDAIMRAIRRFCSRPGFDGDVQTLWLFITWRRVIVGRASLDHTQDALDRAELQLPRSFFEVPKLRRNFDWHLWMMASLIELDANAGRTRIMSRTPVWDEFERNRESLLEKARRDTLAHALRNKRHFFRLPEDKRVDASTRLAEMVGYTEPWRPGDY